MLNLGFASAYMNILFIGDIFGKPGRETVKKLLPDYKKNLDINVVIANAENIHHGKGVSEKHIIEMRQAGVDFFTSGNHIWKEKAIIPRLSDKNFPLIRPANYPPGAPGYGYRIIEDSLKNKILVINLMGRVFMPADLDCPFRVADRILKEHEGIELAAIFVDFHAEATSEKMALGHYLNGRVSAIIGTHTHVPTFDARVLADGTAFQSDVGFTGPIDSVIGAKKEPIIQNFLTQVPTKHEVADGKTVFNAIKIKIDEKTRRALVVEQIQQYV